MKIHPIAQKRPFILAVATAMALTLGSPLGHAVPLQPGAAARAYWFTNTPATGYVYAPFNNALTLGQASYSHSNAAHTLSTNAFMGEVKLFNEVIRTTSGTSVSEAEGGFQDMITIDDPTRTGHQGVFNGSVHVHMNQSVTGAVYNNLFGVAVWSDIGYARLALTDGYAGYGKLAYDWFNNPPGISLNADLPFSIGFTFGTPFSLGVWMRSALGVGQYGDPGTIQHDATNTLSWNGITSIEDTTTSTTVDPGAYTAMGDSGMNWIQPVPEPSSALLLAGSGLLLALRRRRASAP